MKLNEANWDRVARVVLGIAGIAIAVTGISPWGWVGIVLLVTGSIGWCPIYAALKIKTSKEK